MFEHLYRTLRLRGDNRTVIDLPFVDHRYLEGTGNEPVRQQSPRVRFSISTRVTHAQRRLIKVSPSPTGSTYLLRKSPSDLRAHSISVTRSAAEIVNGLRNTLQQSNCGTTVYGTGLATGVESGFDGTESFTVKYFLSSRMC